MCDSVAARTRIIYFPKLFMFLNQPNLIDTHETIRFRNSNIICALKRSCIPRDRANIASEYAKSSD